MNDTTLSAIAWASIATPIGIAAGIGWIRCARMLAASDADGYKWWAAYQDADSRAQVSGISASLEKASCDKAIAERDTWKRLASDLQERLDTEAAKRSSITSRGNLTKAAKRRAAQDARTAQLNQEIAERMDVTADRIAA